MQCDVFTSVPCKGNGLAVVLDGDGLSDAEMQDFAAWTNLAETTFLLSPSDDADYRVRIFTPGREMPFAGHPTLGSCACWLHAGGVAKSHDVIRQECAIGIVEIDMTGAVPAFVAPPTQVTAMDNQTRDRLAHALNLRPDQVRGGILLDNGPEWQVLELASAQDVLDIDAALVRWPDYVGLGVVGAYPPGSECGFEVRNLAPSSGMSEDPITGSLNAAIARWFVAENRLPERTIVSQGTCMGRLGRVHITRDATDANRVLIGGNTRIVIQGTADL